MIIQKVILLALLVTSSAADAIECDLIEIKRIEDRIRSMRSDLPSGSVVFLDAALQTTGGFYPGNIFYSEAVRSQSVQARQIVAAEILGEYLAAKNSAFDTSTLQQTLRDKSNALRSVAKNDREAKEIALILRSSSKGTNFGDAATFVLETFKTLDTDGLFRLELIRVLGEVPTNITEAMMAAKLLIPLARGFELQQNIESTRANDSMMRLSQRFNTGFPPRLEEIGYFQNRDITQRLLFEPIEKISELDTTGTWHANKTLLVQFASGIKAVFKPMRGELYADIPTGRDVNWIGFKNEVNAFHIYDTIRLKLPIEQRHDPDVFVPDTVETVLFHDGTSYGIGSLQVFIEGFRTLETIRTTDDATYRNYDASQEMAVARLIKNLLGDYDSFPNSRNGVGNLKNVMVKPRDGGGVRIGLIDNGIGRLGNGEGLSFPASDAPVAEHLPNAWKNAFKAVNAEELATYYREHRLLHSGGIDDLIGRLRYHQQRF